MIEIKKGKEPNELIEYRKSPNPSYQDMHGAKMKSGKNVYDVVLAQLINEQGHLCAYCMRRIPERKSNPAATIEHIEPQSSTGEDMRLNYKNMLAVCSGNRNSNDDEKKTCDARRGSLPIEKQKLYINPLNASTLQSLEYNSKGEISSNNKDIDNNLNETLNLNYTSLVDCRMSVLGTFQTVFFEKHKNETEDNRNRRLSEILDKLQQENENKTEYQGILIYWIKKKLGQKI
jgi:uncharacterized protein (TIGR02646 family)